MGFVTAVHAGRSLEISNLVDIRSEVNYELAMRVVTDVVNGNRFYTDLNSFQVNSHLAYIPQLTLGVTLKECLSFGCPGADAAATDALKTPPAGQLLPDDVSGVLAGLVVSFDSVVGSESGRRFAETR